MLKSRAFLVSAVVGTILLSVAFTVRAAAWTVDAAIGDVNIESKAAIDLPPVTRVAAVGDQLAQGDAIVTGGGAIALITDGKSEIRVAPNSRFRLEELYVNAGKKPGALSLQRGAIRAKLKRNADQHTYSYEIRAKDVVASVRGTEFFVEIEGDSAKIHTLTGVVQVRSATETIEVPAGKSVANNGGKMGQLKTTEPQLIRQLTLQTKADRPKTSSHTAGKIKAEKKSEKK